MSLSVGILQDMDTKTGCTASYLRHSKQSIIFLSIATTGKRESMHRLSPMYIKRLIKQASGHYLKYNIGYLKRIYSKDRAVLKEKFYSFSCVTPDVYRLYLRSGFFPRSSVTFVKFSV